MPRLNRALTVLAPVAVLAMPAIAAANCGPYANAMPSGGNAAQIREATLCLVNNERTRHGLAALTHNATLEASAQWTANDLVARRYFGHTTPDGKGLEDKMAEYIARTDSWSIGENLAWGDSTASTPAQTVVNWMNSPGHRANILNGTFVEGGIGVVTGTPQGHGGGGTYANHFGKRTLRSTGGGGGDSFGDGDFVDDVLPVVKPKPKPKPKRKKARRATSCAKRRVTVRASAVKKTAKKRGKRTCRRSVSRRR